MFQVDHAKDAFVILVTDGVTFSLSNDDVVRTAASGSSTQQAAHRVVQLAIDRGSHDNSSAIVLPLRPWEILQHEEATPGLPLGTLLSSQDMRRARDYHPLPPPPHSHYPECLTVSKSMFSLAAHPLESLIHDE